VILLPFLFMGVVFVIFIGIFVAVITAGVSGNPASKFDRLSSSGVPARGILLQVAQTSGGMAGPIGRRFQRRSVRIDIEVPGRAPYEVNAFAWIPMNCVRDVLPGATVEVRVDPTNPQNFMIVGPGVGFAPPIAPMPAPTNQGYRP
jgi:hypothetical protein